MKKKILTIGFMAGVLVLTVSCDKTTTGFNSESSLRKDSKDLFGENSSIFDDSTQHSSDYDYRQFDLNGLKMENSYFVFENYTTFFNALITSLKIPRDEYIRMMATYGFTNKNAELKSYSSKKITTADAIAVQLAPFRSYFNLLDKNGAVKIGEEIHIYKEMSLVIVKNGDANLIAKAMTFEEEAFENDEFLVVQYVASITNPIDYNLVPANNDNNHLASVFSAGFAVQVTSSVAGAAAYNYDFHVQGNSLVVNIPNFVVISLLAISDVY